VKRESEVAPLADELIVAMIVRGTKTYIGEIGDRKLGTAPIY